MPSLLIQKHTLWIDDNTIYHPNYVRAFFVTHCPELNAFHNYEDQTYKNIYHYPKILYRSDKGRIIISSLDEAIEPFHRNVQTIQYLNLIGQIVRIRGVEREIERIPFGLEPGHLFDFRFQTPWIALNQKNYQIYTSLHLLQEKKQLLQKTLIGNILSLSKLWGYTVPATIEVDIHQFRELNLFRGVKVPFIGFFVDFQTNYLLPDGLGIGKMVSKGYGLCEKKIINKKNY